MYTHEGIRPCHVYLSPSFPPTLTALVQDGRGSGLTQQAAGRTPGGPAGVCFIPHLQTLHPSTPGCKGTEVSLEIHSIMCLAYSLRAIAYITPTNSAVPRLKKCIRPILCVPKCVVGRESLLF